MSRAELAPKIFLAHARVDKPQVRKLYADLKARGLDPWLDEVDLLPGQNWEIEIHKAIRQAGIFLACLSSRSVGKVGFVQNEFRQALSAFGERPPGAIFLIPVRLDECEVPDLQDPHLGLRLRAIHWVDLWEKDGFDHLIKAIEHALGVATPTRGEALTAIPVAERRAEEAHERELPEPAQVQVFISEPPRGETGAERAQRQAPEPGGKSLRNVTAIIGAIATGSTVLLLSWLLEKFSDGNGKSETPSAERVVSPETTPSSVPMTTTAREPFRDCDDCPLMVVVPAGSFTMGSPESEGGRSEDEGPQHRVTIAEPFAMGQYEVTFDEWDVCVKGGGCRGMFATEGAGVSQRYEPDDETWGRGRRPVINVSWKDAQAYVEWLSKETGASYRLLSEVEWEYAARAGTTTRYWWGDDITSENANYGGNVGKTTAVGSYPPNPWGLRDMHGNVWEWVEDCWNDSYEGAPNDGSAWTRDVCSLRVLRGGSWYNSPGFLRSADRDRNFTDHWNDDRGFRVARTLP